METILAIELDGSSLRAALVGRDGAIVASAARHHRTGVEEDAATWWSLLEEVVGDLPAAAVRAIVPSGFGPSQVLVDGEGNPVRPAQCFHDGRAAAEAAELADATRGTWLEMMPSHPLARLRWVRDHDPAAFARARHVLTAKDWLVLCLTGRLAGDRIGNAWALERRGNVRALSLFRRARMDAGLVPELFDPWQPVGPCTAPGSAFDWLRGVPVLCGGPDTWCASLGVGAGQPGDAYLISGTTDAGGVLTDVAMDADGLGTQPWAAGLFRTGGPSGAGSDCVQWLADLLGQPDPASVVAVAEVADPGAPPLLFLPALAGEKAPGWSAPTRAAFAGLDHAHGPAEMARAVLEGVAFADRDLLGGLPFDRLFLGGGGARSDLWCQIRADVLGCTVIRAASEQPGITGAALVGWTGLGFHSSIAAAQTGLAAATDMFRPHQAAAMRYQRLFEGFKLLQGTAAAMGRVLGRL